MNIVNYFKNNFNIFYNKLKMTSNGKEKKEIFLKIIK